MKKILSICAGLILSIGMAFATDEVTVNPLTIVQGESGELEIVFSAEGEYKGFQFDIAAPAGVTADVNEDGTIVAETGDSLQGFSVSSRHLASGADRFIVTSFVGNQFTADGSILKVTYTTDADLEPGEYTGTISGIKFTTAALQTEKYDDVNFMVTVVEKPNEPGDTIYSEGADIDHWTKTDYEGVTPNGDFHLNTWSTEGETDGTNMLKPFLEYWVWSGNGTLSPATIAHKKITGIAPGLYTASLRVRAYNEGSTNTPTGARITANGQSKELSEGSAFTYNGMAGVYADYSFLIEVGADSTIDLAFDLYDPNFNWIAIKNLTVVYGGVPEVHTTVIDVAYDRLVNQGYAAEEVAYDEDAVKAALGIEDLSAATLAIVDVTTGLYHEYPADYSSDGWLNSDGDATTWGSGSYVCLKVPSDGSMTLCTMPSNEPAEGSAFNAKWAFYTATDTAILNVTINFVSAPAVEAEVVATIEINHDEAEKTAYSGTYETVDVDAVCAALGITSIDEAEYRVAFPNEEEGGYTYESVTTDGWRNAETGAQLGWGNAGGICVKVWADNDQTAGNVTYIGCYDDTHEAGEAYTFYYAFIANNKSVIYKVNINFVGTATAIDGIANGEAAPKGVYNINGQKLSGLQKGLNIVDGKKVLVK